jgi:Isoleucyl-tRNA synthetase (EC 6.1.1.5)
VPVAELVALDRWAIWRTHQLQTEVIEAYRNYQFHLIYQKVHNFCSVDLGGFYLDVLKDRLYTTPAASHARRSAQTAMYWIIEAMVRWLAPILSFTAEEIWKYMPGERAESVFLDLWCKLPEEATKTPDVDWKAILELRSAVSRELEKVRNTGAIGAPLDANIDIYCSGALLDQLRRFGDELRFIFITSEARVHPAEERPAEAVAAEEDASNAAWIVVKPSTAQKCIRCWHKRDDVGQHPDHPEICGRCVVNVAGPGEERKWT